MPKSDGNLLRKVLFKPKTNPAELGGLFWGRVCPRILSPSVPGFWDGALGLGQGRETVGEMGQMPMERHPPPGAGGRRMPKGF